MTDIPCVLGVKGVCMFVIDGPYVLSNVGKEITIFPKFWVLKVFICLLLMAHMYYLMLVRR